VQTDPSHLESHRASANVLDEEIEKYPFRPDRILPKPYTTASLLAMVKALLPD